jgi:uncharacterized protein with HEPN domain
LRDERLYIVQMLERAERIFEYTEGGHDEFLTDPKTQEVWKRIAEDLPPLFLSLKSLLRNLAETD